MRFGQTLSARGRLKSCAGGLEKLLTTQMFRQVGAMLQFKKLHCCQYTLANMGNLLALLLLTLWVMTQSCQIGLNTNKKIS